MGIFSTRINREGAIAGMLCGLLFTFGYIVCFKGIFMRPLLPDTADYWLLGISPEGIGAVGMVLNVLVAVSVSLLGRKPPASVRAMVRSIRVPRSA